MIVQFLATHFFGTYIMQKNIKLHLWSIYKNFRWNWELFLDKEMPTTQILYMYRIILYA